MSNVIIMRNMCKGMEDCGICAFVCPKDIFIPSSEMNEAGYIPPELHNIEDCISCLSCMISCPDFAIIATKVEKNKEEVSNG